MADVIAIVADGIITSTTLHISGIPSATMARTSAIKNINDSPLSNLAITSAKNSSKPK